MKIINISDETYNLIKGQIAESENKLKEKEKINITIKNRFTSEVIFESEKKTYKEAVMDAISREANLSEADLRGANLRWANLRWANLSGSNLRGADLSGADLLEADLSGANLSGANLSGANLRGADLSGSNLSGSNLRWANLSKADLNWTNLSRSQLNDFLKALGIGLLEISNKSYDDVGIKENSVIYCDPPYKGTFTYQEDNFNHEKFYN